MRRFLHVIAGMDPKGGGVCQAVRTMIAGLNELGLSNEVISLDPPNASFLSNDTFIIHALGKGKGPWLYNSKLIPWLLDHISRFDVIIVHGLWLYPSYGTWKALRKFEAAVKKNCTYKQHLAPNLYIMPHGMLDPYFQQSSERRLKAVRNWAFWQLIEKRVINDADGVLFTCEEEKRLAAKPFSSYFPKKELVVGLGVEEPPIFNSEMKKAFLAKCPNLGDSPYFLFLSRIHEKKGVDMLIKAYLKAYIQHLKNNTLPLKEVSENINHNKLPNNKLPKLIIAGPGLNSAYGLKLKDLILQSGIDQNSIIFPDMLTGDAKWGAFYGCEAFVLPSHQENFGIAVVEALACSKPVLISNQVNIWREIESIGGGIIKEDTQQGTDELLSKWLKLSTIQKENLCIKARQSYNSFFEIKPTAKKIAEIL